MSSFPTLGEALDQTWFDASMAETDAFIASIDSLIAENGAAMDSTNSFIPVPGGDGIIPFWDCF
jgi:hypothetical protein